MFRTGKPDKTNRPHATSIPRKRANANPFGEKKVEIVPSWELRPWWKRFFWTIREIINSL